jgi:hypothetical protein
MKHLVLQRRMTIYPTNLSLFPYTDLLHPKFPQTTPMRVSKENEERNGKLPSNSLLPSNIYPALPFLHLATPKILVSSKCSGQVHSPINPISLSSPSSLLKTPVSTSTIGLKTPKLESVDLNSGSGSILDLRLPYPTQTR